MQSTNATVLSSSGLSSSGLSITALASSSSKEAGHSPPGLGAVGARHHQLGVELHGLGQLVQLGQGLEEKVEQHSLGRLTR